MNISKIFPVFTLILYFIFSSYYIFVEIPSLTLPTRMFIDSLSVTLTYIRSICFFFCFCKKSDQFVLPLR